jgi:hypothetical protein
LDAIHELIRHGIMPQPRPDLSITKTAKPKEEPG